MDARFVTWPAVDGGEMAGVGVTAVRRPRKRQTRGRRQHRQRQQVYAVREPALCAHCGVKFLARAGQVFCGHSCRTLNNRLKRELAPLVLTRVFGMPLYKAEEQLEKYGLARVSGLLGDFKWTWDARTKEWRQGGQA